MANGIIDFRGERGRHERLLGREDVMAELDALLLEGEPTRGWVLVKGGPGMGKSALLAHWLARREAAGHRVPHHFLRRQVEEWDRPEVVLQNLVAQLEALGYRVVGADDGLRALEVLKQMAGIDLLFTDVVMPGGMNGRQLADAAKELRPELKVLFTSGYTENAIV
ncbi:MAG TPA: response regulator, partial [Myxococcaceae bacterium]|nr:response regulator [Myxococcaceae bacterium]